MRVALQAGSQADSRAEGLRERDRVPRAQLGTWNAKLRRRSVEQLLHRAMRGRVPALLKLKHERMAASPFSFFRGALPVMAYDLSLMPRTQILTQLCGDAHVQNFGAFAAPDGSLIFDLNDFDETLRGPFEWDVKRMATSILLAAKVARISRHDGSAALRVLLSRYCVMLREFASMPVMSVARFQVHRTAERAPIAGILRAAERATPSVSLKRLTRPGAHGRVFKIAPPLLSAVSAAAGARVLHSLDAYRETLPPERQRLLAQFHAQAVAFKAVGTGSLGLRNYCVYLEGNGRSDPLFLQVKEETRSALAPYLAETDGWSGNQGRRVVEGQHAAQFQSDPLLGWTRMAGRDYLVRQLNDHKATLDVSTMKSAGLVAYAEICGEILARAHARAGDARMIGGYVGKSGRFAEAVFEFAQAYATQTTADWKEFTATRSNPGEQA